MHHSLRRLWQFRNERRKRCKEKLLSGSYSPIQFLERISCYIGNATSVEDTIISDDSDMLEEPESFDSIEMNKCVVCQQTRSTTWVFMPCRHANCCTQCSDSIHIKFDLCIHIKFDLLRTY